MKSQIIGHPDRIGPFQNFLKVIASNPAPVLVSGPVGSGKKRTVQFLMDNGPAPSGPSARIEGLELSAERWERTWPGLEAGGTLIFENLQHLPPRQQSRFRHWLKGEGPLFSEKSGRPPSFRILATTTRPREIYHELLFQFHFHVQLPSLNEVAEDIPYHLKIFLQDKPVRYLRYFFLLKTFFHQWGGNLLELTHYLDQTLAYYQSQARASGVSGGDEVFGERRLRFYQDVLKGEWWYYPYRFPSGFTAYLKEILNKTDFRGQMIREGLVLPLMKDEPGFLVLDLKDPEFETKANRIYHLFSKFLDEQPAADQKKVYISQG